MFDKDRWQEIYHTLKSNKLRTFLTAFGIFWGIFMLVIMLGAGNGLENGVYHGMGDFATNSVFIWTQRTTKPYKGFKKGRYYNFKNDDIQAIKNNIEEVELLAPRLQVRSWNNEGANNVIRKDKTGAYNILGDYPEFNEIDPVEIVSGRFINYIDIEEKRKVAIIGNRVYEELFEKDVEPVGEYIRINGVYFKVAGLFKSKHNGGWAEWQEQCIFLPFTTLQKTFNYGDNVGWFSMTSNPNVPASVAEKKVKAFLRRRHDIHPDDKEAIGSFNLEEEFMKFKGLFFGIAVLVWIVGTGTLIAGVIGVSNIMLVIVRERTQEIGIQRAIGATPLKIMSQIILESVFLTSVAGYVGLVFGVAILEGVNYALSQNQGENVMFTNPEIDFSIAITALIILIISGLFAGLIPARRAVSIKPIDAIREEK